MSFNDLMAAYAEKINLYLDKCVPDSDRNIEKAMRYSVAAGGKRIRPILTLASCEMLGADSNRAIGFACALELIHTYSLIYDDLPCMDNDVLRRGKPTNHVVFGEDIALMAGMGLYARAFEVVLSEENAVKLSDAQRVAGMRVLADASGLNGIVLGQVLDIDNVAGKNIGIEDLNRIHNLKTSAMLEAAVKLGCIAAQATDTQTSALVQYAKAIGLAFQIRDDILDVIGTSENMGKSIGKDKESKKITFVDLLGLSAAQEKVAELTVQAKQALSSFENNTFLSQMADFLCGRTC